MDPDNIYSEEAPVSMASSSADDENDSIPPPPGDHPLKVLF